MSSKLKNVLFTLLSAGIALLFLWLAFRDLDFSLILEKLQSANYFWVFSAGVFALAAYWFRALRWKLLIEPLGYSVKPSNALWGVSFGYFMNLFVPRSGEIARATALYGTEKVPVDKSIGTIILDRLVDFFYLGLFVLCALFFRWDALVSFYRDVTEKKENGSEDGGTLHTLTSCFSDQDYGTLYLLGSIFLILGLIATVGYIAYQKRNWILSFLKGLSEGLLSILKLKQKGKFLLLSTLIWISYYLAAYLVCFALKESAGFTPTDGVFLIVVGTFGMIIPASGGVGAFHLAIKYGVAALFLSKGLSYEAGAATGMSYAILSHALQTLITLVMGFLSIPAMAAEKKRRSTL